MYLAVTNEIWISFFFAICLFFCIKEPCVVFFIYYWNSSINAISISFYNQELFPFLNPCFEEILLTLIDRKSVV